MAIMKARNSSEQWYRDNDYNWMTGKQWECFEMLCDLCRGARHVIGKVKPSNNNGIVINCTYNAATFDFSGLTEAVIMAHDRCIRFAIEPCNQRALKLLFHKRSGREGGVSERHPTLEQTIESIRK